MQATARTCMLEKPPCGGPGTTLTLYAPPGTATPPNCTCTQYFAVSVMFRWPRTDPGPSGRSGSEKASFLVPAVSFHRLKMAAKLSRPPAAASGTLP
jgi:hypothetical protein